MFMAVNASKFYSPTAQPKHIVYLQHCPGVDD